MAGTRPRHCGCTQPAYTGGRQSPAARRWRRRHHYESRQRHLSRQSQRARSWSVLTSSKSTTARIAGRPRGHARRGQSRRDAVPVAALLLCQSDLHPHLQLRDLVTYRACPEGQRIQAAEDSREAFYVIMRGSVTVHADAVVDEALADSSVAAATPFRTCTEGAASSPS